VTNIAILTPCILDGDAVSNDVVGMYRCLSKYGYQAKVFAENWAISAVDVNHVNKVKTFLRKKKTYSFIIILLVGILVLIFFTS